MNYVLPIKITFKPMKSNTQLTVTKRKYFLLKNNRN